MKTALAALAAIAMLLLPADAAARQIQASALDLLDYYNLGHYEAVAEALAAGAGGDLVVFHDELRKGAGEWIAADAAGESARRRRVVATVALEAASAGLDHQWVRSLQILQWTCGLLRSEPAADAFERDWHLAALALIEGARDSAALEIHMVHMRERVPDEPRLLLARAFVTETQYWDDVWIGANVRFGQQNFPGASLFNAPTGWGLGGNPDRPVGALEAARQRPENRREAALRLGYLAFAADRPDQALVHLGEVGSGDDAGQVYLANLFAGWAHSQLGHPDEAMRAFRAAVAAVPHAQAAALALAVRLLAAGNRDEAAQLAQEATEVGSSRVDPWREYGYGDLRRLPVLIDALRRRLR